jgi:hypothetical protein
MTPPPVGKCFDCNFANLRTWTPSKILLCESCVRNGGKTDNFQAIEQFRATKAPLEPRP